MREAVRGCSPRVITEMYKPRLYEYSRAVNHSADFIHKILEIYTFFIVRKMVLDDSKDISYRPSVSGRANILKERWREKGEESERKREGEERDTRDISDRACEFVNCLLAAVLQDSLGCTSEASLFSGRVSECSKGAFQCFYAAEKRH